MCALAHPWHRHCRCWAVSVSRSGGSWIAAGRFFSPCAHVPGAAQSAVCPWAKAASDVHKGTQMQLSQGGGDGLAHKADTSAPSFYYRWNSDVSRDQEILASDLNFTYLDSEFSNVELVKWVLRGSLRHKLAEWEGEAKQGFYFSL